MFISLEIIAIFTGLILASVAINIILIIIFNLDQKERLIRGKFISLPIGEKRPILPPSIKGS